MDRPHLGVLRVLCGESFRMSLCVLAVLGRVLGVRGRVLGIGRAALFGVGRVLGLAADLVVVGASLEATKREEQGSERKE